MKNLTINEINNLYQISVVLCEKPFYKKLGAGGILAIYLTALELNLPVMFSLNGGIYNIEGKVSLSSHAINMMLINAGWEIIFEKMDNELCILKFKNPKNGVINENIFTIDDAHRAGYFGVAGPQGTWLQKPKDNWLKYPKDMLFARCIVSGGRKFAPDVLGNCYLHDELGRCEEENTDITYNSFEQIQIPPALKKQPEINFVDNKGFDNKGFDDVEAFKKRHNIVKGEKIYDYVLYLAKCDKLDPEQALNQCFLNEPAFIESFKRISGNNS